MSNGINSKFFNFVSQMAHWATMCTIVLVLEIFFSMNGLAIGVGGGLAWGAWKEFWYDPHYENRETRGSDAEDFLFYCTGIALAVAIYFLARRLGKLR